MGWLENIQGPVWWMQKLVGEGTDKRRGEKGEGAGKLNGVLQSEALKYRCNWKVICNWTIQPGQRQKSVERPLPEETTVVWTSMVGV